MKEFNLVSWRMECVLSFIGKNTAGYSGSSTLLSVSLDLTALPQSCLEKQVTSKVNSQSLMVISLGINEIFCIHTRIHIRQPTDLGLSPLMGTFPFFLVLYGEPMNRQQPPNVVLSTFKVLVTDM